MKLKLDTNGNVVVQDGRPVYVKDDGTEVAFDAVATTATITRLNGEAKAHRERAEAAETGLKKFEGITDPAAAIQALQTVQNLNDKKLVDAGQVEQVKAEAIRAVEAKYAPIVQERDTLQQALVSEKIGGSFARSKFITEKCAIPADFVEARFGRNFELKDGKVVAKDHQGNVIYSNSNPGELADFDEALETLVNHYPNKAQILKGSGASGTGTQPSGGTQGGKQTITRSAYEQLPPHERGTALKDRVLVDG